MLRSLMRRLLRPVLRTLARFLFRIEVSAQAIDFHHPRLLVVANHQSFLDGLLLGLFLPINPVFVVHTTIPEAGCSGYCCRRWITCGGPGRLDSHRAGIS